MRREVEEIFRNFPRWELEDGNLLHIIYEEESGNFRIASINSWDNDEAWINSKLDSSLWFKSYSSARKYFKDEVFVEGKFKKISL